MFATVAGAYNRRPNPGLPDVMGDADRDLESGRTDTAGHRAVEDDFVREILTEQGVVELAIVSDGGVRLRDRVLPWIAGLSGIAAAEETSLPDGERVTRPRLVRQVQWTAPVLVPDWQFADQASDLLVKQTLIGPYTLAALAEAEPGPRRAGLALRFAEALNRELAALAEAGCEMIEIDEPLALRIGGDASEWRGFRAAAERMTAGIAGSDGPHLSLGLCGGEIDRAGHAALLDPPFLSYLVDVLAGPSAWRFIASVPPERGIIAGSADATSEAMDETEVHVWAMAWAAQGGRGSERVGCAPNGTLGQIGRHFAHRKCGRLGEAVRIASMGPLQDVAEALDEHPEASKMPELRALAAAVAAGRAG